MPIQSTALAARALPQLSGRTFLTDGGIETTLIFHEGFDLPLFAAFILLETGAGRTTLRRYYEHYLAIAAESGTGFVLESPTWRASWGWGERLGYAAAAIAEVNRDAIALMADLRDSFAGRGPVVISGCIGPQGDGYSTEAMLTAEEAEAYHVHQVRAFAETEADMVTAVTMTYAGEAIGIVRAARAMGLPVAISFTTETDGRLPSGQPLGDAIEEVDAATGSYAAYFMINCAHPTHFADTLRTGGAWREPHSRRPRQRLDLEPRGTGRGRGTGRRRSARVRPGLPGPEDPAAPTQRPRRLLRHRSPPRRCRSPGLRRLGPDGPGRLRWPSRSWPYPPEDDDETQTRRCRRGRRQPGLCRPGPVGGQSGRAGPRP